MDEAGDKSDSGNALISLGILKLDLSPLKKVADKYGGQVLRRVGPIIDKELNIFQQRQVIRELENLRQLQEKFEQIKAARGLPDEEPSPSIAEPLIEAAASEERSELLDLWAKLLAAAIDPQRKNAVRRQIIDAAKQLEPFDVGLLEAVHGHAFDANTNAKLREKFRVSPEDVEVSIAHLRALQLMAAPDGGANSPRLSAMGRILMRAVSD